MLTKIIGFNLNARNTFYKQFPSCVDCSLCIVFIAFSEKTGEGNDDQILKTASSIRHGPMLLEEKKLKQAGLFWDNCANSDKYFVPHN